VGGGDQESGRDSLPSVAEPLGRVERAAAVTIGIAAAGAGGYAVFSSSNQAGTAILLILSAIFLLIGVQGTSLIRFSTGTSTVELERRRRVERALENAVQEPDLERAEAIVEGIAIGDPSLPSLPEAQARLYKRKLGFTIDQMGYRVTDTSLLSVFDFAVHGQGDSAIAVEVKYSRIQRDIWIFRSDLQFSSNVERPVLFVANNRFDSSAHRYELDEGNGKIRLVTWRDEGDNDYLLAALLDLLGTAPA